MTCPGSPTGGAKFPVAAYSVTQWTHGDVVPWMTNLHARINRKAHAELYFCFYHCLDYVKYMIITHHYFANATLTLSLG